MNIEIKPDYAMDSAVDQKDIVVIDSGTDSLKIGFSGSDWPQVKLVLPSIVGIQTIKNDNDVSANKTQYFYGGDVHDKIQFLDIKYPINRGRIEDLTPNTSTMAKFWINILENQLNLDLTAVNLLFVDSPLNDKDYKKELADILFEEVKISSLLFMNSSVLSLFSTGRTRGLVVESGHGFTSTLPVFEVRVWVTTCIEFFAYCWSGYRQTIDGCISPFYLKIPKALVKKEPILNLSTITGRNLIKGMKEKILTLAIDYEKTINGPDYANVEEKSFELPDGKILEVDHNIRYSCPEILFKPSLINSNQMALHEMVDDSFQKCDPDLQMDLNKNIVVCGGTSLMKGFSSRLAYEMDKIFPKSISRTDINYVTEGNRNYAAWIGGSMLGSLSVFQELAIKKSEYEENADAKFSLIHKKSF